jgi:hypothetical protein
MRDVSYWEAWSLWWDGRPNDNLALWGWPLLRWGLVGQRLQFVGGLTSLLTSSVLTG